MPFGDRIAQRLADFELMWDMEAGEPCAACLEKGWEPEDAEQ